MRFLEQPGFVRALVMGMGVGLAQEFKYNGWLAGGMVIAAAILTILVRSETRKAGWIGQTFGWGFLAAGVAWLVVWPWYAFVEAHGGYSALLHHQRSYLGGFRSWWPNLLSQANQAVELAGGEPLILAGCCLAGLTPWIAWTGPSSWVGSPRSRWLPIVLIVWASLFPSLLIPAPYWLGLVMLPWLLIAPRSSTRLLGVWWLILSVMTPFYHPYARLLLPYHAVNWVFLGWLVARGPATYLTFRSKQIATGARRRKLRLVTTMAIVLYGLGAIVAIPRLVPMRSSTLPGLFDPSDSLYLATVRVAAILPEEVQGLRLLVRPPVTFYLGGRTKLFPMEGSDQLLKGGDPKVWALVDSAILRSEAGSVQGGTTRPLLARFAEHWEIVEKIATTPSLPTLLDLDPDVSRSVNADRNYPLWLLRPRTSKAPR